MIKKSNIQNYIFKRAPAALFFRISFFNFGFGDKGIVKGFDYIFIVSIHEFNGFKLVDEFFIGEGVFHEIIGSSVYQKNGSNFE